MTRLIDRIRMWLCKHEWSKGKTVGYLSVRGSWLYDFQTWHCTKCGYSKEVKI